MLTKNGTYTTDSFWDQVWSRPYVNYEKHHQVFWNLIKANAIGSILDLGCGSGSCWKGAEVEYLLGVDFSPQAVREFQHNTGFNAQVGDVENLNLDRGYNTVVLSGVVNYYRDLEKIKRQLKLHADERIIITINVIKDFPDREWDQELINKEFGELGAVTATFYDKIGWFIIIDML